MGAIVYGHFTDELDLLKAVEELQDKGIWIADVRTPFPVHGLDKPFKIPSLQFAKGGIYWWFNWGIAGLVLSDLGIYQSVATRYWRQTVFIATFFYSGYV
jgi:hypothetical protein